MRPGFCSAPIDPPLALVVFKISWSLAHAIAQRRQVLRGHVRARAIKIYIRHCVAQWPMSVTISGRRVWLVCDGIHRIALDAPSWVAACQSIDMRNHRPNLSSSL